MDSPAKAALTDYLAAERTVLAWIRTGLALMGFGFVVARFGFFLQELRIAQRIPSPPSYGLSTWFGTALVALGVIVNVASGWNHARLLGRLDRGEVGRVRSSKLVVAFAFLLALLGLGMAIYLISIRTSTNSPSSSQKSAKAQEESMALIDDNGIVNKASNHSVEETVKKIQDLLQAKGVTLFALVDHSGEAAKVGMNMPPTKLLIFGSPKA